MNKIYNQKDVIRVKLPSQTHGNFNQKHTETTLIFIVFLKLYCSDIQFTADFTFASKSNLSGGAKERLEQRTFNLVNTAQPRIL
ncbi:MAG: hypothetical protein SCG82_02275 [Candidatus Nitrotoga sp.]|jgi:hypothetical protein|nr:hypothetical protein [Candidatus Nitrotoga sp.]MDW7612515.1 hypothetical protein [Candidatus Nitrotoga sp.]MDW7625496.1 hypothetical protein [Candidatus Nitrotoga sp.]